MPRAACTYFAHLVVPVHSATTATWGYLSRLTAHLPLPTIHLPPLATPSVVQQDVFDKEDKHKVALETRAAAAKEKVIGRKLELEYTQKRERELQMLDGVAKFVGDNYAVSPALVSASKPERLESLALDKFTERLKAAQRSESTPLQHTRLRPTPLQPPPPPSFSL